MTSTTTTNPTALTIDGAAATLAALPDSPDVRTAAAMLAAAPTTASGTLRKWMTAHDGETVDTLQFRTWCGHDTLAAWAPTDRTIDASRAGSVRFNGSTLDYRGVRVIGADDVSIVTLSDEFLTVYRLSSARPAAEVVTDPDAAPTDPTDPRPTTTVTNDQGVTFHARLIRTGDRYGLVDKLTNDGAAMVEFFDAEADPAKFGPLGQFVSRYYVDTFNETAEDGRGIALEGSVPRWTISAANVAEVAAWLASLDTPAPLGAIVAPDKLNAVMEFDHVVTVNEDGTVSDGPSGIAEPVRYIYVETTNEEGRHNESIGPFPTAEDATAFLPLALADPSWSIIDAEVRADYEAPLVAHWVHEWPAWIAERSNEWGGDAPEWSLALLAWQDEHPDMWAKVEAAVAP